MKLRALVLVASLVLLAALPGCDRANPNVVDEWVLRPTLPGEQEAMRAYLAAPSERDFRVYDLAPIGKFYIDDQQDLIKRDIAHGKIWEPHLLKLFLEHVKRGSTVIDVGAHIGVHTLSFARLVGPEGRVYAFEPQRKVYRELVNNLRLNKIENVVPLRYALGHTTGITEMSAPTPGNEGSTGLGKGGDRVELRALDSFAFRNVSLIKIDVEHFEDFVLEGGQLTILRNRPVIVIEIMGGHFYERASPEVRARIDATRRRLELMGYQVTHIYAHDYLALPQ